MAVSFRLPWTLVALHGRVTARKAEAAVVDFRKVRRVRSMVVRIHYDKFSHTLRSG
ncbi:MAG: hypothetical protein JXQ73_13335 [Phycisphaerae bacterium]|nr:hypothetical protein [Phycisphaerae bacterium]